MTGCARRLVVTIAMVLAGLAAATPAPAHGRVGVYFGMVPPVYLSPYPYPYPYPRPYYPPHPYYAAPAPPAATEGCYAGPYVCPLEGPSAVGMPCSCPTTQGRAWGRAR
ncbi:MAG: hypothetical protein IT555_03915 [Acetobacteraceae bacterium]|nr:hypothetical protein [Acetobacteraceae bacterium]